VADRAKAGDKVVLHRTLRPLTPFVYPDFTQELNRDAGEPNNRMVRPLSAAAACGSRPAPPGIGSLDREKCDGAEHRAGEKAPYTGLKPAGTDFGPAIPAAEKAIETGTHDALVKLLSQELTHGIAARVQHALGKKAATKEPATKADVPAARERVSAELEFIGYVEGIHLAITGGGGHAE
jgi:Family of unknown function (DUF6448)